MSVKHAVGDLFTSKDRCLAHCVSADLAMGAGIARAFKAKYGGVAELRKQNAAPGGIATLQVARPGMCIINLVTKNKYWQKPTLATMEASLVQMAEFLRSAGISAVSMPRIGCGLDRLKWSAVEALLKKTLAGSEVVVTVWTLPP